MFSIVIPLYNKEQTIERAIRSVLDQSVQDFEIVVVDDGSTDSGAQVVQGIRDTRIRLIHQENAGVSAARNCGIAEARSELIAFLDADDEWKPTFLETVDRLVCDFPEAAVFATGYLFCQGDGGTRSPTFRGFPDRLWEGILDDYFNVATRSDPPLCSSAVVAKRDAIGAIGGFPVGVVSGEDLLTWAKLAVHYRVAFSTELLAVFHLGDTTPASSLRRLPDVDDPVGRELQRMLDNVAQCQRRSFRRYVAMWNKMRASVLLRAGRRSSALRHALRAVTLDPLNWRHCALVLFALFPQHSSKWLFSLALNLRQEVRRSQRR